MTKKFKTEKFKEQLELEHNFPALYMFKFIVPSGKEGEVAQLLPNNHIETKHSSRGNYVSVTIQAMMQSSDAIINIYEKAASIEGVIAL